MNETSQSPLCRYYYRPSNLIGGSDVTFQSKHNRKTCLSTIIYKTVHSSSILFLLKIIDLLSVERSTLLRVGWGLKLNYSFPSSLMLLIPFAIVTLILAHPLSPYQPKLFLASKNPATFTQSQYDDLSLIKHSSVQTMSHGDGIKTDPTPPLPTT